MKSVVIRDEYGNDHMVTEDQWKEIDEMQQPLEIDSLKSLPPEVFKENLALNPLYIYSRDDLTDEQQSQWLAISHRARRGTVREVRGSVGTPFCVILGQKRFSLVE